MQRRLKTMDYMFLHCKYSRKTWEKLVGKLNFYWVIPRGCSDIFQDDIMIGHYVRRKAIWNTLVLSIGWFLWVERNNRVFDDKENVVDSLCDLKYYKALIWLSFAKPFKDISPFDLLRDWSLCL